MDALTKQRGFSLVEIMIAMAIAIIAITGVILGTGALSGGTSQAVGQSADSLTGAETNAEAQLQAQAIIEKAQADAKNNFDTLASATFPAQGIYARNLTVAVDAGNPDIKHITGTVTWSLGGRTLTVQVNSLVSNPRGGAKCSPTLSGDWTKPTVLSTADIGQNDGATDLMVYKKRVYATARPSASGKPTFYIIDVNDPVADPLPILKALDTGRKLNALYVSGDYAFVATNDNTKQLQIIDITNPSTASVKREISVVSTGVGESVYVKDDRLYLGLTHSGTEPEFRVFDISGFLANPTVGAINEIGSWSAGADVNKIAMKKDGTVYVATGFGTAATNVYALNVSALPAITPLGSFTATDDPASSMNGLSVILNKDEDTIYLGRSAGAPSKSDPEFYVLPANPATMGSWTARRYIGGSDVNAATVRSNLAFLITSDSSQELKIFDMGNLAGPVYGSLNMQASPTGGFDCFGNLLYIAERSSKAMQIVGPAPDYQLVNGGDITTQQGIPGMTTITRILVGGYSPAITASIDPSTPLPAGTTATWTNNPCTPTCSSQLTLTPTIATAPGTYPIKITASPSGASAPVTTFNYVVTAQPFDYTLSNTGAITVTQGNSGGTNISRTTTSGTPQSVSLSVVSGLPAGATASFTGNPCTPSPTCSSGITITTTAATPIGTYPITIKGTPGGVSNSQTTFNLVVNAPTFDYSLGASPATLSFTKAAPGTETITVTKIGPAAAQPVTITLSGFPAQVSGAPASRTCTPAAGTCSVTFTISIANTGHKTGTITVSGTAPARTTTFNVIAN